ncbi:hypothetical protein MKX01_036913 [Papaver californicum]|nr:hypothetical protein MKX01_036913 [Papaver californicum]
MKSTDVNLVRFLSVLSFSSLLFLTVFAQKNETNSTVTGKTNTTDVMAIQSLIDTFSIPASTGDPCIPEPYSWVKCTSGRVTEINLTQMASGSHLPDFSAMDALEKIDLSNNIFLTIEFPDFLANFPKLKVLNLAVVPWTGTVPTSLRERSENKTLNLTLSSWGTKLCYSDEDICPKETNGGTSILRFNPPPLHKKDNVAIVLGILIPIFLIFWAIIGFLAVKRRRKAAAAASLNTPNHESQTIFSVQGR